MNQYENPIERELNKARQEALTWLLPPSMRPAYNRCQLMATGKFIHEDEYDDSDKSFLSMYANKVLQLIWIFSVVGDETFTEIMENDEAAVTKKWYAAFLLITEQMVQLVGTYNGMMQLFSVIKDVGVDFTSKFDSPADFATSVLSYKGENYMNKIKCMNEELAPLYIAHPLFNHLPKIHEPDDAATETNSKFAAGEPSGDRIHKKLTRPSKYDWERYITDMRYLTVDIFEGNATKDSLTKLHLKIVDYEIDYDDSELENGSFRSELLEDFLEVLPPLRELTDVAVKSESNRVKLNVGMIINQMMFILSTFGYGLPQEEIPEYVDESIRPVMEKLGVIRDTLGIFDEGGNVKEGVTFEKE